MNILYRNRKYYRLDTPEPSIYLLSATPIEIQHPIASTVIYE